MRRLLLFLALVVAAAVPLGLAAAATKIPNHHLSAKGGTVSFSATVSNARTCTWSSKPKLARFNVTAKCKGDKVDRSAKFKANTSTSAKSYAITLTVRGKTTTVDRWTVLEAGRPIAVTTTTTTAATTTVPTTTTTTIAAPTTTTTTTTTTLPPTPVTFPGGVIGANS